MGVPKNKAIFWDMDGTIIFDMEYNKRADGVVFLDEAIDTLHATKDLGYLHIIVSNQSGINRGFYPADEVEGMIKNIRKEVVIDDYMYCPHHPDEGCDCRKPLPGLILTMAKKHNIDLEKSFMVGNTARDIVSGNAAGCTTVFVYGKNTEADINIDKLSKILDYLP